MSLAKRAFFMLSITTVISSYSADPRIIACMFPPNQKRDGDPCACLGCKDGKWHGICVPMKSDPQILRCEKSLEPKN